MFTFARLVIRKLRRDRHLSLRELVDKGLDYTSSTIFGQLALRGADHVGARVRTVGGPPRLVNYGSMTIGDDCRIVSHIVKTELCTAHGAELLIGNSVHMNYGVSIGATKSVRIGNRVRIGPYARVVDSDFHDVYNRAMAPSPKPVVIEDDAWIGMNAVILPGVRIGRASIVGTGCVVTRDVPDFTVVGGVPARVLRQLDPAKFVIDRTNLLDSGT
jgi:UDP-3-O-[3-hydroxymyristoyl] glucosamine N-acyltransferase